MNAPIRNLALATLPLTLVATMAAAAGGTPQPAAPQTYDQIVRLSLVEGDVRIARGLQAEHASGGVWGLATADLPIQAGFSLATGAGRAEIEFEDASTVYLSPNSVLIFDRLTSTDDVPHTELTLVSGAATLHVLPATTPETFTLQTPAGRVNVPVSTGAFVRVNSFLDAMQITPQDDASIYVDQAVFKKSGKGQSVTYYADHTLAAVPSSTIDSIFADWDAWTAKRIAARSAAMAATMKQAGLVSPIPGLADLANQGRFFDCAPFGTCWQPTGGWSGNSPTAQGVRYRMRRSAAPHLQLAGFQLGNYGGSFDPYDDDLFPCTPYQVRQALVRSALTGQLTAQPYFGSRSPYGWAVCHAGSWVPQGRHYAWVSGAKKHHHAPVRWVQYGRTKAYVPIHPHDAIGKPPLNLQHGVYAVSGHKDESVERIAFNPSTPVKLLNSAPKPFLATFYPALQHADAPRLEAHTLKTLAASQGATVTKSPGTPIVFNRRSQSFAVATPIIAANHTTMVTQHFGGSAMGVSSGARSESGRTGSSGQGSSSGASASRSSAASSYSASAGASHSSGGSSGGGSSGGGGSHH